MPKVWVCRYRVYDVTKDEFLVSTRLATPERIIRIGAGMIPGTGRELDDSLVKDGWTEKNFHSN